MVMNKKNSCVYMKCTTNGHNKFYNVWAIEENGNFQVWTHWGRIGNEGSVRLKATYNSKAAVTRLMNKLTTEKEARGYVRNNEEIRNLKTYGTTSQTEVAKKKQLDRFIAILD